MKTITLFILLFITLSCNKSDDTTSFSPQSITPTLISKGIGGINLTNHNNYFNSFTTESEWLIFKTNNILSTSFNPNIDFNQFDVIVCVDFARTTGGYDIAINSIVENQNNIVTYVQYIGNGDATQMPTRPYIIVKIPKLNKPIVFQ